MATNRSYTVIGLFLLGAIVLIVVAVLAFGGTRLLGKNYTAVIFFDQSVLGLTDGSKVLFRGVQVGTVKKVQLRLDPRNGKARIAVTIEVGGNNTVTMNGQPTGTSVTTEELVKRGLRAQLVVWSYVTSQLAVNLDFRPESKPKFVGDRQSLEYPEIPSVPSQIEQLKDTVSDLPWKQTLTKVNTTMQSMVTLANDMDNLVTTLGPQLTKTSDTANNTLQVAQAAIDASDEQIKKTLAGVRELTNNVNTQLESRDDQIGRVLDNAETTSKNLNTISRNLRSFTDPASGERQDIDSAIRDLSAAASSLRSFSENLERDPNALLFGGSR